MRALLLIDHGSRRAASNELLSEVAALVESALRARGDHETHVSFAHMELAGPSIAEAFEDCVAKGVTEIVAHPYMLGPGRHATEDIPRMVSDIAAKYDGVTATVSAPLGLHPLLAEVVLDRCFSS